MQLRQSRTSSSDLDDNVEDDETDEGMEIVAM